MVHDLGADLRKRVDYGRAANQRIHQMVTGKVRWLITYKAERLGMQVVLQDEAYSSKACPRCERHHKPRGREYICSTCGFRFRRDGVGSIHIRRKYLGLGPVVGAMASPTGVRWKPHRRTRVARDERERIPGIPYKTARRWVREGKMPVPFETTPSGTILVHEPETPREGIVALYARISSPEKKADLERQVVRLLEFANSHGLSVRKTIKEIGSGLNGRGKKLLNLLSDPTVTTIIEEHRGARVSALCRSKLPFGRRGEAF